MVPNDLKPKFIEHFAKQPDTTAESAFKAGLEMFPGETGKALWVQIHWGTDADVIRARAATIIDRIESERKERNKPVKDDILAEMLEMARDWRVDPKVRHDMYKTVLAAIDAFPKQGPAVVVNNQAPRVMVVKDFGTDDEWEKKLSAQQQELTNGKFANATVH